MHIACTNNNGIKYLRLVKSAKGTADNGTYKQIKTTVLNIGPLKNYDDGNPDYLKRLRKSFKEGNPIIDKLLPYVENTCVPKEYTIQIDENNFLSKPKIFSNSLLDMIFDNLGLRQFFTNHKSRNNIEYDLLGVIKLLTYGRILNPDSKIATFEQRNDYYGGLHDGNNPYIVYDVLDVIADKRINILQTMNKAINKKIGRHKELIFYDVTNFYTEAEQADADELVNGEEVKGLRQRGVSKENRKTPIVQTGLFMDDNGIPISFETFSGNTLDQATLRPALKKTVNDFELARYILVADKGMNSAKNRVSLLDEGNGYIMSQGIAKSPKDVKEWIIDDKGYKINGNATFKVKSQIKTRIVLDENNNSVEITEKIVCYWSEKFYKKQYYEHKKFLDFLEDLKENPASFRVFKKGGYLNKFLKKESVNLKTGEKVKNKDLLAQLDEKKVEKLTAYMGYYILCTSEIEMEDVEVINKYRGLTKIEDQFRIMKSDLNSRPIYVSTREHINAHFTICFIALVMMRLIQHKIKEANGIEDTIDKWEQGLPAKRIQKALNNWQVEEFGEGYHRFHETSNDLNLILNSMNVEIENKLYVASDMKKLKASIKI